MPTDREIDDVYSALVESGLEFIETAVKEVDRNPKFSVAHFATGLELLLKARLFNEHWALVAANPHQATWRALQDGTFKSLQASDLCSAITSVSGESFDRCKDIFKGVFKHRNRSLHFLLPDKHDVVVAEQLRAWYHLHRRFHGPWSQQFQSYSERINRIESTLLENRKYLIARYEEMKTRLEPLADCGKVICCPVCKLVAGRLETNLPLSPLVCEVCKASLDVGRLECGNWRPIGEYFHEAPQCECGATHTLEELADTLDPLPVMSPKDMLSYSPSRYHCGECMNPQQHVIPIGEKQLICLDCGHRYSPDELASCDWCNEGWAGYDTEHSWTFGCEFCDGRSID